MDNLMDLCQQLGIPLWVVPLVEQAAAMKCDTQRRRLAYKLIHRRLREEKVGLEKMRHPTYIYPQELKDLLRTVFPGGVCNYPDPQNSQVVHVTLENLHAVASPAGKELPFCRR